MSNAVQKTGAWGFLVMLRLEQDEKEKVKLKRTLRGKKWSARTEIERESQQFYNKDKDLKVSRYGKAWEQLEQRKMVWCV